MIDETRYPDRIWARRYSNCVVGARDRPEPYSPLPDGYPFVEYVRADLGSFYQEKGIDALMAERDAMRQRAEKAEAEVERLREALDDIGEEGPEEVWPHEAHRKLANLVRMARAALRNEGDNQ